MNSFCIISAEKYAGKTHVASIIAYLSTSKSINAAYYKPFIMNVKNGDMADIDYIKRTTNLNASDIYTSFACRGHISPMHSSKSLIDIRDITDTVEELKEKYDLMIFESLGLYDPIRADYLFRDLILDINKITSLQAIITVEYDTNIITNTLSLIEQLHTINIKISMVVINQNKNLFVDDAVIDYLKEALNPIKVVLLPFENNAGNEKITYLDDRYNEFVSFL